MRWVLELLAVQVIDAAMEAGADDVQPATGEQDEIEGFKVSCDDLLRKLPSATSLSMCHPLRLGQTSLLVLHTITRG